MKLIPHILRLIEQMDDPSGTSVDDLMPHCLGHSRREVAQALYNASNRGQVLVVRPLVGRGTRSPHPSRYTVTQDAPEPEERPLPTRTGPRGELGQIGMVRSVWDYAQRAA